MNGGFTNKILCNASFGTNLLMTYILIITVQVTNTRVTNVQVRKFGSVWVRQIFLGYVVSANLKQSGNCKLNLLVPEPHTH